MTTCLTCPKAIENEAATGVLCRACFDTEQGASQSAREGFLSKVPTALIVACAPFIMTLRWTSSASLFSLDLGPIHWEVHAIDYLALALGPVAVVLGVLEIRKARTRDDDNRNRTMGLAALAVVLGAYQVYRGLH